MHTEQLSKGTIFISNYSSKKSFYKDRVYLPQGNTTKEQKQRLRLKQYNNEENIFILYVSCILYIIFKIITNKQFLNKIKNFKKKILIHLKQKKKFNKFKNFK